MGNVRILNIVWWGAWIHHEALAKAYSILKCILQHWRLERLDIQNDRGLQHMWESTLTFIQVVIGLAVAAFIIALAEQLWLRRKVKKKQLPVVDKYLGRDAYDFLASASLFDVTEDTLLFVSPMFGFIQLNEKDSTLSILAYTNSRKSEVLAVLHMTAPALYLVERCHRKHINRLREKYGYKV